MEQKYKLARLVDCNGDLNKEWYVIFYVWNADTNTLQRKRDYSINSAKTKKGRKDEAEFLIKEINKRLIANTYSTKIAATIAKPTDFDSITFYDAMYKAFELKKTSLKPNTIKDYNTLFMHLGKYLAKSGLLSIRFKAVGSKDVHGFFDYLKSIGLGNKSYNNHKGYLSTLFNTYIAREEITINPVKNIKKLKVQTFKHEPYTNEQMSLIKNYLYESDNAQHKQLLYFISFIYYCFIRPGELRLLKVKDILEKTIRIPADIAKNGNGEHVVIPSALEKIIVENKFRSFPPDYFLFSLLFEPSLKSINVTYFWKHNMRLLKALNLEGKNLDLYGYKHTGVINLYNACKDIKAVQKQCRHSTIQQTDTYLRGLGIIANDEVLNFPEF